MNIDQAAVIVGMGEMGGVFARGLLREGNPVVPILRHTPIDALAIGLPSPQLVLVTVGEADLDDTLTQLPHQWKTRTGLVQNELLPRTWKRHNLDDPTVAVVWFEKKPGRDVKVIIPTPIYGPRAGLLTSALASIDIPVFEVSDEAELMFELVRKNLYILTANIGGLVTKGTVNDLWYNNRALAEDVASDVLDIQQWLTGAELDRRPLVEGMVKAFDGDPDHGSTGRSAPTRLARALDHADQAGLKVPRLREISTMLDDLRS
jgi:hypothetical protein